MVLSFKDRTHPFGVFVMYRLISPQAIIDNVATLAMPYLENKNHLNEIMLKQAYCGYLNQIQPQCPYRDEQQLFYSDIKTEEAFSHYFTDEELDVTELEKQIDREN